MPRSLPRRSSTAAETTLTAKGLAVAFHENVWISFARNGSLPRSIVPSSSRTVGRPAWT
jgi:hypothetical protein